MQAFMQPHAGLMLSRPQAKARLTRLVVPSGLGMASSTCSTIRPFGYACLSVTVASVHAEGQ